MTQLTKQARLSEEAAGDTNTQMRQLEGSLGQAASSLVTLTENLAAETTDLEAMKVCRAASESAC